MARTITLEGDLAAVDTRYTLTAQGSVTAPSLVVPSGMTKITKVIAAASHDGAADDGSELYLIRLGGNAVMNGEQTLVIGGAGNQTVQSGSDAGPAIMKPFILNDVDIEVRPSDTISVAAEAAGVDIGTSSIAVTLVYGA